MSVRPSRTVAVVVPRFHPETGGCERYAEQVARAVHAAADLNAVVVTTGPARRGPAGSAIVAEYLDGLPVIRITPWLTLSNTPVSPLWPAQLLGLMRRLRVDLVNVHTPVPYLADVATYVAGRRPVVLTYHAGSMVKGSAALDPLLRGYERWVLPHVLGRAAEVVGVSAVSLGHRIAGGPVIPPGVDTALFGPRPAAAPAPHRPPTLTYVGRLQRSSAWKGVDILLTAFATLLGGVPDARLELVGDGDAVGDHRRRAVELGVADRVSFRGVLRGERLAAAYQAASVVVLPSLTEAESFGMVLVEAMSCGRPVVGSRVGGIPSLLTDGHDGLLVPPGDPPALAAACRRVLTDPALATRLGANGRQTAVSRYAWRSQTDRYLELFRRLLGAGRAAGGRRPK